MFAKPLREIHFLPLLFASFVLMAGCDASGANDDNDSVAVEGRVTDDSGYSKSQASIEGATVTAVRVNPDGGRHRLSGETTTDAQGRFELNTDEAASNVLILRAEKESFATSALVYTKGRADVRSMPMTTESHAEADVYVEARKQAKKGATTIADVAAHVDADVAAEIAAEKTTAAKVAAAIRSSAEAEAEYIEDEEPDAEEDEAREQKREAFFTLQVQLAASSDASAQAEAIESFEAHLARAYMEAGASAEAQARASLAARSALVQMSSSVSSKARLALRKRAEVIAALATAHAVEAEFEAEGASQAEIDALVSARAALLAELRAADSESEIDAAHATYQSSVEAALSSELDVDVSIISAAQVGFGVARQTLNLALSTTSSAKAVATAYAAFYTSVHTSAMTSFDSNAKADLAATVLVLLSAQ